MPDLLLEEWLGRNLRRANSAVLHSFSKHFAAYKIRPALFAALCVVEKHPQSSGARLSELLALPRTHMVLILRELEHRKLISRAADPTDRRAHVVSLSAAGRKLMPKLHDEHSRHIAEVKTLMTPTEYRAVNSILLRLWKQSGSSAEDDLRGKGND